MRLHRLVYIFLTILILLAPDTSSALVTADPHGIGNYIRNDNEESLSVTLTNSSDFPVHYLASATLREEAGQMLRRDDAGDQIDSYDIGERGICGLAWDGQWIWGASYISQNLVALNPENGDIEVDVNIGKRVICMTYLDGLLWAHPYGEGTVRTYDLEGEFVEEHDLDFAVAWGITSNQDDLLFVLNSNPQKINVYQVQEDGIERINTFDVLDGMGVNALYGIEWVPAHRQGMLWGHHQQSRMYQAEVIGDPAVDDCEVEAVSNFAWNADVYYIGITHDGENMWHGMYNSSVVYEHDDGISEFSLVIPEPYRGTVESDSTTEVVLLIDSNGIEDGIYVMQVDFELDDANQELLSFDMIISVGEFTGDLRGTISDNADDEPVENVLVEIEGYNIHRLTNADGFYRINDLPPGDYSLNVISDDFIDVTEEFTIEAFNLTTINIELRSASFVPTRDDIIIGLSPGESTYVPFAASNPGIGYLEYSVKKVSDANGERDQWEYQDDIGIEQKTEDAYLNGIVYADGYYYLSGGNSGGDQDDPNYVYIMDEGFRLIDKFEQFGTENFGMNGLTWDGQYLYGVEYDQVWVFTTEGELVDSIQTPTFPTNNIAYDEDNDLLWVSTRTGTIYGIDFDGDIVEIINHPIEGRIYAFDYFAEDPDGYCLYMQSRTDDNELRISKMNIETADVEILVDLDIDEATPAGMSIASGYNADSWTLATIVKTQTDFLRLWHLDYRLDWLDISPKSGTLGPGQSRNFSVRIETDNFPRGEYTADLIFNHNGVGSQTVIPVQLTIEDGRVPSSIYINLRAGWNMISANLEPDEPDIRQMFTTLVANDVLDYVKDFRGEVYIPGFNVNTIGDWAYDEGYLVRCTEQAELVIDGLTMLADEPIGLEEGWQLIAYYPDENINPVVAFENIEEVLLQAKDDYGRFYLPQFGFSNMPPMKAGKGYRINISEDIELVYNVPVDTAQSIEISPPIQNEFRTPVLYSDLPATGSDMSLLVDAPAFDEQEVGVYAGDLLVGSGVIVGGKAGIPVRGDDNRTEEIDGARAGDILSLAVHNGTNERYVDFKVLSGEMSYASDGITVVELAGKSEAVVEQFGLVSSYPNPFNSTTRISYNLPEAANLTLKVYDLNGRLIQTILEGRRSAGHGEAQFEAASLPSGVYIVELKAGDLTSRQKVMLLR